MTLLCTAVFPSDLGWLAAVWNGRQLCEMTFGHANPRDAVSRLTMGGDPGQPDAALSALIKRLQNFAGGDGHDDFLDVKLDTSDFTEFARLVTTYCRRIPSGQTLSYGELAMKAGYPGAARAVGSVMRKNRWPLIVPCHRVVAAGGRLGGFSAPNGLDMKQRLLALEGTLLAAR